MTSSDKWYVTKVKHKITGKVRYTVGAGDYISSELYRWRWHARLWARGMNRYYGRRNDWVRDE